MSKFTRRQILAAGGASSAALLAAPAFSQGTPIRIGVIQTLSGPAGAFGKDTLLGAQIAADQINGRGGVAGRKIELVVRDDKGTPNDSLAALREVTSDGVNLILGSSTSAPALAVLPVLEQLNAAWIMPGGTNLSFTHELFTRHFFHGAPNAYMYYVTAGKLLAQRYPNVTKWTAIVAELAATQQLAGLFWRGLREGFAASDKKLEILPVQTSKFGAPDYRTQISAIRNSGAEGLLLAVVGGDSLTFLQQARGFGMQEQIKVYFDATNGLDFGKGLKQNVPANSYSPCSWAIEGYTNAASRAFDAEARKRTGEAAISATAAQGHNGITSYAEAVQAANSTDTKAVIAALETVQFKDSIYGPYRFRKEDHQAMIDVGFARFAPKATPPGWEVAEFIRLPAAQHINPPSPGVKFNYE